MNKEIHFYEDEASLKYASIYYFTAEGTRKAINAGDDIIHTTQMALLSFSLVDKGYDIWLHKNDKSVRIKEHMPEIEKDIRKVHNLFRLWIAGTFNKAFE